MAAPANTAAIDPLRRPFTYDTFKPSSDAEVTSHQTHVWNRFKQQITAQNQNSVVHLVVPSFANVADFQWIDTNLPSLERLDISPIQSVTGGGRWAWNALHTSCPSLFARLRHLAVFAWDSQLLVTTDVVSHCTNLEILEIRGDPCLPQTLDRALVHDSICHLLAGIAASAPNIRRLDLRMVLNAELLVEFANNIRDALPNLQHIAIDLSVWISVLARNLRKRFVTPTRTTIQSQYSDCDYVGHSNAVHRIRTRGGLASGEQVASMFSALRRASRYTPLRQIEDSEQPSDTLRFSEFQTSTQLARLCTDEFRPVLRFLHTAFDWTPIFPWDEIIQANNREYDSDEEEEEDTRPFRDVEVADGISVIVRFFQALRAASFNISVLIGDEIKSKGARSSLLFTSRDKTSSATNVWLQHLDSDASKAHLDNVAPLIDSLFIGYDFQTPKLSQTWGRDRNVPIRIPEAAALDREGQALRIFWHRHAFHFTRLSRLYFNAPEEFDDLDSIRLGVLLKLHENRQGNKIQTLLEPETDDENEARGLWTLQTLARRQGTRTDLVSRLWTRPLVTVPDVYTRRHWTETDADEQEVYNDLIQLRDIERKAAKRRRRR